MKTAIHVYKRILGETDEGYALFLEIAHLCGTGQSISQAMKSVATAHDMAEPPAEWGQWAKRYLWKARLKNVLGGLLAFDEQTIAFRSELAEQGATAAEVNEDILTVTRSILRRIDSHLQTGEELPDRALLTILPSLIGASLKLQDARLDRLEAARKDTIQVELWND